MALASTTEKCNPDSDCPFNFANQLNTSAEKEIKANIFVGPESSYLVEFGAKFSHCMREDKQQLTEASAERAKECGSSVAEVCDPSNAVAYSEGRGFSCCEVARTEGGVNVRDYGMTDRARCNQTQFDENGNPIPGVTTAWMNGGGSSPHFACLESTNRIILRPCCNVAEGTCSVGCRLPSLWVLPDR